MGAVTKQTQTRNNNSENEKICTRHTQAKRHKTCTRAHKTHNKLISTPNPNRKTSKSKKTTRSSPARVTQATHQQNKKKPQTKPVTKTINKGKKGASKTQQAGTQNFNGAHTSRKHSKSTIKKHKPSNAGKCKQRTSTEKLSKTCSQKCKQRKQKAGTNTQPNTTKIHFTTYPQHKPKQNRFLLIYEPQQEL